MALQPPQPPRQLPGVRLGGVDPLGQSVFEDDPPAGLLHVIPAGLQHLVHGIPVRDGHRAAADFIVRRMQGHAQGHRQVLLRQSPHLRHQPAGAEAHVPQAQMNPVFLPQQPQEAHHLIIVVQRLPAAHEHHVGNPVRRGILFGLSRAFRVLFSLRQKPVGRQDFPQHLPGAQAADAALQGGRAEFAAHPAAHLGGDAEAVSVVIPHQHPFDAG